MDTDTTTENDVDIKNNEGEEADFVKVPKADYDKLNQTLGSYKRELKDLKKPKEEVVETPKNQPSENSLIEKAYLRSAGITKEKEVELALTTAKKWGMGIDQIVDDGDFQVKLDKLRTNEANLLATSGAKGTSNTSQAKSTPDYWIAKGTPPTPTDIPDGNLRRKISRAFLDKQTNGSGGKTFYND